MENLVNFLLHYYREIILAISVVLQVVILLFKKQKINISSGIYKDVIYFIDEAEKQRVVLNGQEFPLDGKAKLNYVIDHVREKMNVPVGDNRAVLDWIIAELVEDILSTPTKKGGPGRDEEA